MNFKPILIVSGEPNSVFSELLFKSLKIYKSPKPIVLIGSFKLINSQLKKLGLKLSLNLILLRSNHLQNIKKNKVNIIDINYKFKKPFEKSSSKSKIIRMTIMSPSPTNILLKFSPSVHEATLLSYIVTFEFEAAVLNSIFLVPSE